MKNMHEKHSKPMLTSCCCFLQRALMWRHPQEDLTNDISSDHHLAKPQQYSWGLFCFTDSICHFSYCKCVLIRWCQQGALGPARKMNLSLFFKFLIFHFEAGLNGNSGRKACCHCCYLFVCLWGFRKNKTQTSFWTDPYVPDLTMYLSF